MVKIFYFILGGPNAALTLLLLTIFATFHTCRNLINTCCWNFYSYLCLPLQTYIRYDIPDFRSATSWVSYANAPCKRLFPFMYQLSNHRFPSYNLPTFPSPEWHYYSVHFLASTPGESVNTHSRTYSGVTHSSTPIKSLLPSFQGG